uniref:Uncharacterized protein n=1 Tax=viral metagenome TaxID=1070528 RepID=A0A6C0JKH7_9ZZZZ
MKKNYLGFNTWGNNGTYGRTSIACGSGIVMLKYYT